MPRIVDNGAGLSDNNGKPKLLRFGPPERVNVGIRNSDDSGAGLRLSNLMPNRPDSA